MDSEEPDYMSDDFLVNCVEQDIRPGLLFSRTKKREQESLKRKLQAQENQTKAKNKKGLESQKREEGLQQPIDSSNKGFALLEKMGYKPGAGIGKNESGRTEPIGISVKIDRKGLGRESAIKEIKALKASFFVKKSKPEISTVDFRARLAAEAAEKHANSDLRHSQRVCYQLDIKEGTDEPAEEWFWPPAQKSSDEDLENEKSDEEESEEDENEVQQLTVFEKLKLVTTYLRSVHFYCIWCGVQYNDIMDLEQSCPGAARNEH